MKVNNYISSYLLKGMAVAALAFGVSAGASKAQVLFSEDFDGISGSTAGGAGTYAFPSGWFLRNVDNRTPNTSVAYVNEAWERREDLNNVTDSIAMSTSWYTPAGASDDWMWTPLISGITSGTMLNWNAMTYDPSYPDGYEVRIMTQTQGPPSGGAGTIGNQVTNSTQVFTIAAENTTWTPRSVSLSAYAGQNVYVGFRNNSNDMFILAIDDVVVQTPVGADAVMLAADTLEYTIVPEDQQGSNPFNGTIRNAGGTTLSNVYMTVNVYDGGMTQVYTANSAVTASLAMNTNVNVSVPATTLTSDFYTFEYIVKHSVADGNTANDTLYNTLLVDPGYYARDNGNVTGGLGIGAGNGGYLGQQFHLYNADRLDSVLVYYTRGYTGRPMGAVVWDMLGGAPNQIIAATDTLIYPDDSARVVVFPIAGGGINLPAGDFVVTVIEFVADSTVQIGLTDEIFTLGKTWVNWPTTPLAGWGNNEAFGASFSKPYVIRPILNYCPAYVSAMSSTQSACGGATGTATINVTGGPGPFTYVWNNGQTTQTANGLAAGAYTVTVTDGLGCTVVDQTIVTNPNAPTITSTAIDNALCNGDNGLITPTVTGGSPAYTFVWSTGATTTTLSAPAGTYSVTIVDQSLCSVVATGLTVTEPAALVATVSSTNESAAGANDGSATANVSGGTGAYTYLWSNGGTTQTINGLAAGTYTVTVTDANGCATNSSSTVIVGINDIFGFSVGTYPNPSNGSFMVSISMPEAADFSVMIVDMMGKTVFADEAVAANTYERQINLGEKANGMYFLNVKSSSINKTYKIEVRN